MVLRKMASREINVMKLTPKVEISTEMNYKNHVRIQKKMYMVKSNVLRAETKQKQVEIVVIERIEEFQTKTMLKVKAKKKTK